MIEAGTTKPAPFDVVIVHSFSRFFRDHFELEFYIRKLAKNGIKLVSITQEIGDDPMHVMMRQMMALFDEYHPDNLYRTSRIQPARRRNRTKASQDRADRRRAQIAELNQHSAETDLRLKRLYDAIESGIADLADPALKDRIAGLKAIRDQSRTDAEHAQATLESSGNQSTTPDMVRKFASAARERMRLAGGGYRRDHLRALAQRVEVAGHEVRIKGSKGDLLRTLSAASGMKKPRARRSQFCSEMASRRGFEPLLPP